MVFKIQNKRKEYKIIKKNKKYDVKYFSKSNRSLKDEYKQISLDTQNINEVSVTIYQKSPITGINNISPSDTIDKLNINFEKIRRDGSALIEFEYHSTEAIREINTFLKALDLERYTHLFIKHGFDDLNLVVNQMKSDMAITDQNLKEIGIHLPGHRAKILLKLEEECNNFEFPLPEIIYHSISEHCTDYLTDHCVKCLQTWLSHLKLDQYTLNFINNGYHSLELLFICNFNSTAF